MSREAYKYTITDQSRQLFSMLIGPESGWSGRPWTNPIIHKKIKYITYSPKHIYKSNIKLIF